MKDEIKEILEYYRKYMSIKDCVKLSKIEDYITNLQESEAYYYGYYEDYKQRIEKAIEIIKIAEEVEPCADNFCILRDKLKNILEGKNETRKEN